MDFLEQLYGIAITAEYARQVVAANKEMRHLEGNARTDTIPPICPITYSISIGMRPYERPQKINGIDYVYTSEHIFVAHSRRNRHKHGIGVHTFCTCWVDGLLVVCTNVYKLCVSAYICS